MLRGRLETAGGISIVVRGHMERIRREKDFLVAARTGTLQAP